MPCHYRVEDNEKINKVAKKTAIGKKVQIAKLTSLTYIKQQITKKEKL